MRKRQQGITLIEVLVALAVAAVLIGIGLPAFNGFVAQRTLTTQVNDFIIAVQYARSEASRRGEVVSVRPTAPVADNEWGGGWCVVVGQLACDHADAEVLRVFPALGSNEMAGVGTLSDVAISLRFTSRGYLHSGVVLDASSQIELCNPDQDRGRAIVLTRAGRATAQEFTC